MANTVNYTCRIDSEIKNKSEDLFDELGMNLTTAINVFLREALRTGGFPFEVRLKNTPNKETLSALQEAEELWNKPDLQRYDVEDALAELKK